MKVSKRRAGVLLFILSFLLLIGIIVLLITRQEYINNYKANSPTVSDAEYLETYDLRYIYLTQDKKEKSNVETIAEELIIDSCNNNYKSHENIIDYDSFKRLNLNKASDPTFTLNELNTYCLYNNNKAIVYYSKTIIKGSNNHIIYSINTSTPPFNRIYFEKINENWCVVSIYDPA
ncbi:MAG: hypothetical protein ACI4J2_08005 [Ruminococcus sp.]